ncbi:MAG: exosortase/archaeosortase family protein, partial [Candidatus Dormiibacterota bacterium]
LPAAFLIGALAVAYVPVLLHGIDVWRSDSELSFGFVVPPIALLLVWWRHPRGIVNRGPRLALAPIALGLLLLVVGARTGVHAIAATSVLPAGLGLAGYLGGLAWARALFMPLALLTGALALYRGLLAPLGFALQLVTAISSTALAQLVGEHVQRVGVDLYTPTAHFVVAEACSGMDSLLALLCLGGIVVALAPAARGVSALARRGLLLLLILPVILLANVVRVTLVLVLSQPLGSAVEAGAGHDLLSALLFAVASLLLLGAAHLLECPPRIFASS